eukprot:956833_1
MDKTEDSNNMKNSDNISWWFNDSRMYDYDNELLRSYTSKLTVCGVILLSAPITLALPMVAIILADVQRRLSGRKDAPRAYSDSLIDVIITASIAWDLGVLRFLISSFFSGIFVLGALQILWWGGGLSFLSAEPFPCRLSSFYFGLYKWRSWISALVGIPSDTLQWIRAVVYVLVDICVCAVCDVGELVGFEVSPKKTTPDQVTFTSTPPGVSDALDPNLFSYRPLSGLSRAFPSKPAITFAEPPVPTPPRRPNRSPLFSPDSFTEEVEGRLPSTPPESRNDPSDWYRGSGSAQAPNSVSSSQFVSSVPGPYGFTGANNFGGPGAQSSAHSVDPRILARKDRLTVSEMARVSDILSESNGSIVAEIDGKRIQLKDLKTLMAEEWVDGQVVDFYMALLSARNAREHGGRHGFLFSFFYDVMSKLEYSYRKDLRDFVEFDIFAKEKVFIPIHVSGNHWCLAVLNMRDRRIEYYDSLGGGTNRDCVQKLKKFLKDEHLQKRGDELDVSSWTVYDAKINEIPQQSNCNDCGVFVCKYADFASEGLPFEFTSEDMPVIRKRMILEIAAFR